MKYYINDNVVNYEVFNHYLKKSIKSHFNFTLSNKEANYIYNDYFSDMKYNNVEILFKDKINYKIREY